MAPTIRRAKAQRQIGTSLAEQPGIGSLEGTDAARLCQDHRGNSLLFFALLCLAVLPVVLIGFSHPGGVTGWLAALCGQ